MVKLNFQHHYSSFQCDPDNTMLICCSKQKQFVLLMLKVHIFVEITLGYGFL